MGPRFTLHTISRPPLVLLADREDVRELFQASPELVKPGHGGHAVMPIVGQESLMVLDGDEHLGLRRALAPAFRRALVVEQQQVVITLVESEVPLWPANREVALAPLLRALSLDIILRLVFPSEPAQGMRAIREAVLAMMDITSTVLLTEVILRKSPWGRLRWQRFLQYRADVDRMVFDAIDRHRASPGHLLALMFDARDTEGRHLSDRQVRDNIMSLVLAGHETTASQLAWAFQLLAHHPTAQRRLRQEVRRGAGDGYLTATVHEVQRRRPVLIFTVPRGVVGTVRIGDRTYRPPTQMAGCTYLINHGAIHSQPYRFLPDRFLDAPPDPATWMLWGGGRRVCLGRHLAMAEMKAILALAIARFEVVPTAHAMERPIWRGVIVTPHRGSRVLLRRLKAVAC